MSTTSTVQSLTVETPAADPWGILEEPGLKPERVQEMLSAAPAWQLLNGNSTLHREKKFPDAMGAMLYASYIRSLASNLKVSAVVRLQGLRVLVTLGSHRKNCKPLSEAQLGLAVMIS